MAATAWIIVFLVVVNCLVLGEKKREYKLGLLIPYRKLTPYFQNDFNKGESFAAAMTIAVERINANPTLLADYNLTFVWKDTECNELIAIREQLNQINSGVQAFIGPGCYCQTAAKNAAAFNMTMISFVSMQSLMLCILQSNQVKRTPQEYINEFIIQKLNPLLVVDFRLISAFLHVYETSISSIFLKLM